MCPALFRVLETRAVNKTDKISCLHGACILVEGRDSGQDKQGKSVVGQGISRAKEKGKAGKGGRK